MTRLRLTAIAFGITLFCVAAAAVSTAQSFSTIADFDGSNGSVPLSMIQGADGNLYGVTKEGGVSSNCPTTAGCGTVFRATPSGELTTVYNFCSQATCPDGAFPGSELTQYTDGSFYGTTTYHTGTIFKITPDGILTTLYHFCSLINCTDGDAPQAGLVLGPDGNFYGTTNQGGSSGYGIIFKISPTGVLSTLYNFCSLADCLDGDSPVAGLVLGTNGDLYGTTTSGCLGSA